MMGGVQSVYVREIRLWQKFEIISTIETWLESEVIGKHRFVLENGKTAAILMTTAGVYNFREKHFMAIGDVIRELGHAADPRPLDDVEEAFVESHRRLRRSAKSGKVQV